MSTHCMKAFTCGLRYHCLSIELGQMDTDRRGKPEAETNQRTFRKDEYNIRVFHAQNTVQKEDKQFFLGATLLPKGPRSPNWVSCLY